ncbi:SAM-dependent methyltransferase [Kibdelosporangium philippinense]|uniref:SAM-dependent methyltransferase n=2 Tax=Kibdelosporangium philippinense TaxID=211113 RepID=A0ABS8Z8Z5_9PSEU|nr:SAM-dependent methyltransferase [Kibdelosporangium philippinense]MCE7002322.1 SAM-dependent methyltransferase [Kibdelosporangium philippinense]
MTQLPESPATDELSDERANACRMYDYLLGGSHNVDIDQSALDKLLEVAPTTPFVARENRAYMRRVVRYLAAEAGIKQFLDLGSGIPTAGDTNLHNIVHGIDRRIRVVYVDRERVAVEEANELLEGNPNAEAFEADIRDTSYVLSHPVTQRQIDFTEPLALVTTGVFPFIPDSDNPVGIVATYRDACPSGSYLALSHALTAEHWPGDIAKRVLDIYKENVQSMFPRTFEQVRDFFTGYTLVEPGLVSTPAWRPDEELTEDQKAYIRAVSGLGIKP